MGKVKYWVNDSEGGPSLLISVNNESFHLGYYTGMGNSDNTPIEKLAPEYKEVIIALYHSGDLVEAGRAFTLYPGSDLFKKLTLNESKSIC